MTDEDIEEFAYQAGNFFLIKFGAASASMDWLRNFAKYIEVSTLLNAEKRIKALLSHEDPIVQSGAMTVLKELRREK